MRDDEAGVTLVEILVVLALIGVSAGIVSYALPSGAPERTLEQESALLAARLNLAAERSLISGRHLMLDWQAEGYGFQEWRGDAWNASRNAPLSDRHALARGAILSDETGARRGTIFISPDLLPGKNGVARLWIEAGALRRAVVFDGAAAKVTP